MTAAPDLISRYGTRSREGLRRGIVKWFSPAKGYGFILTDEPKPSELFVHHSEIVAGDRLEPGNRVRFVLRAGEKGAAAGSVERI